MPQVTLPFGAVSTILPAATSCAALKDALGTAAPLTDADLWFVIRCQSKVKA